MTNLPTSDEEIIPKADLELLGPDGGTLYLYDLTGGSVVDGHAFFSADICIARSDYAPHDTFTVTARGRTVIFETVQRIREGISAYPGDAKHLRRLSQPLLFRQIKENNG